jgi:transposase, IS30 family
LRAVVEAKLELRWSPQQIAGWLSVDFPDDAEMRVSHETIYLSLFAQSRGALRKELTLHLRMRHSARRPGGKPARNGQTHIPAMVNIRERATRGRDRGGAGPLGRRPALRPRARCGRHAGRTTQPVRATRRTP